MNDPTHEKFGVDVHYDPLLTKEEIEKFGVTALDNLGKNVDCIIMAVAHDEFKRMNLDDLRKMTKAKPVMIDVRGILNNREAEEEGFYYGGL